MNGFFDFVAILLVLPGFHSYRIVLVAVYCCRYDRSWHVLLEIYQRGIREGSSEVGNKVEGRTYKDMIGIIAFGDYRLLVQWSTEAMGLTTPCKRAERTVTTA